MMMKERLRKHDERNWSFLSSENKENVELREANMLDIVELRSKNMYSHD